MMEQTACRRSDGTFGRGNTIGNRFPEGQSGNPKGRRPERPLTEALRDALDANDGELIETLAHVAIDKAKGGDFRFFREIMDRIDGKVTNHLVSTEGQSIMDLPGLTAEDLAYLAKAHGGPE